jgi:hypothetical protein
MRSKIIVLLIVLVAAVFFNFYNAHRIVIQTKRLSTLEKAYGAEKNINTELLVDLDDLRSGDHIASLVRVELSNFVPQEEQGKIIYVHEPTDSEGKSEYCIIDLISTKAQAKEVQILLD